MDKKADITDRPGRIRDATLLSSKDICTTSEACLFPGVKRSYLYGLVRNRKIKRYKSRGGKLTCFKRKDLEERMTFNTVPSSDK